jgi:hypothetical protein
MALCPLALRETLRGFGEGLNHVEKRPRDWLPLSRTGALERGIYSITRMAKGNGGISRSNSAK